MIASVLQAASFYKATRERGSEVALGFLPLNHIYGLLVTHTLMYYGDSVILHRGFNMMEILTSIATYRINTLYLVSLLNESILWHPVMLIRMSRMQADGSRCRL
jgi:acyl-CoA synthetase (AMP-forming)/AMP-acid ligase II